MAYVRTKRYKFLSSALRAFERAAPAPGCRDFDKEFDEVALRDAPGPFCVVEYDTDREEVITCPPYEHSCIREGCGRWWNTGGERGVELLDATGRRWRHAGVFFEGGMGF